MNAARTLRILALAFALGLIACKETPAPAPVDAGSELDGGTDPGTIDAGDGKCHGDEGCADNEYCELSSGLCLPAKPCATNGDCSYQGGETDDYCAYGACFCDPDRNGGSCRPRFGLCKPCSRDVECGNDPSVYLAFTSYTAVCSTDSKEVL